MPVPNIFASATSAIPLSQLDQNFATAITLGNTAVYLGNTTTSLGNVTLTNVTISSGNVTVSAGSNTSPSITTVGDTNTGIFFPAADTIAFSTNGAERARIDSSGNMGLGVTPAAWGGVFPPAFQLRGAALSSQSNANITHLTQNVFFNSSSSPVYIASDFATRYTQYQGQHQWFNAASGTAGNAITFTQAMTLDASGNLLVGTTSASAVTGSGLKFLNDLDAAGDDRIAIVCASSTTAAPLTLYSTGASAYRFFVSASGTINATVTTITAISDARLKENIRDLDDGLEKVMALQPRKFDWKEGKGKDIKGDRGWIAQEFEQVFPDMIGTWLDEPPEGEDPYKSVRADLIPTLVKAIQEQQAIITSLTDRITALEQA